VELERCPNIIPPNEASGRSGLEHLAKLQHTINSASMGRFVLKTIKEKNITAVVYDTFLPVVLSICQNLSIPIAALAPLNFRAPCSPTQASFAFASYHKKFLVEGVRERILNFCLCYFVGAFLEHSTEKSISGALTELNLPSPKRSEHFLLLVTEFWFRVTTFAPSQRQNDWPDSFNDSSIF